MAYLVQRAPLALFGARTVRLGDFARLRSDV